AERWAHYAAYPSLRTAAFLGRETLRSGVRVLVTGPAGRGDPGRAPLPEMIRWAGGLSGWLRWRCGMRPASTGLEEAAGTGGLPSEGGAGGAGRVSCVRGLPRDVGPAAAGRMKVAVVGCGRIGATHAAAVQGLGTCASLVFSDPDLDAARRTAAAFGGGAAYA